MTTAMDADMEKVASMQAMLADNFWENCGHFWINNNFLAVFTHQCPQFCIIIHNSSLFARKYLIWWKKLQFFGTFIHLGSFWTCGHFSTPNFGLQTEINFFHACICKTNVLHMGGRWIYILQKCTNMTKAIFLACKMNLI